MATAMRLPAVVITVTVLVGCLTPSEDMEVTDYSRPAAYLLSRPYPDLIIEVDHAEGYIPSRFALDALLGTLRNVTDKRSITMLPPEQIPPSVRAPYGEEWSTKELLSLAAAMLDSDKSEGYGAGKVAVLHVLYVDGEWEEDSVAGLAPDATVFMFAGSLSPTPPDWNERHTLIHEAGHVLGLVNNGLPMQRDHEDPASPYHSNNPNSVMHSQADRFMGQFAFISPSLATPYEFDSDDLSDIRAFQALEPARATS